MRDAMRMVVVSLMLAVGFALPLAAADEGQPTPEERYEQLKWRKTCVDAVQQAGERLGTMLETWVTDRESRLNVGRNFELLRNRHDSYFVAVKTFAEERAQVPADLVGLERALRELDGRHDGILQEMASVQRADELFLRSLPSIGTGLSEVASELDGALVPCEGFQDALDFAGKARTQIDELQKELALMRAYVAEAGGKRVKLFEAVLADRRIALLKAYGARAQMDLQELAAKLDAAMALGRLQKRVQMWWQQAAVLHGIGRGKATQELQFTESLRILRADVEEASGFESELARMVDVPAEAKEVVKADLARFRQRLEAELARIEQGGWQAMLASQKALSARRRQAVDRYVPACREALDDYDRAAAQATTVDKFAAAERAYLIQVNTCVARPQ